MMSDAERKFNALIKRMAEEVDFEEDLNEKLKAAGLDKIPDFSFLHEKRKPPRHKPICFISKMFNKYFRN